MMSMISYSERADAPSRRWRSWNDIVQIVASRRDGDFRLKRDMVKVRDRYQADFVIPLYDVKGQPIVASLAPQIVADAIDSGAQRASGTHPSIYVPSTNGTDLNIKRAGKRRDVLYATWTDNRMGLMLHRAYRHLWGYGNTAFVATPDVQNNRIGIELRDPLCVDDQTEVLTLRGWLRHDEIRVGDWVAGLDLDTGLARWTTCQTVTRTQYSGDLVAVDKRGLSMRLTPNHRCIVHPYLSRTQHVPGPRRVIRADELSTRFFIPRAAEWEEAQPTKAIGVDMASLLGWVASEGHYSDSRVCLSQSKTANPAHVDTIDRLLVRLGTLPIGAPVRSCWERSQAIWRGVKKVTSPNGSTSEEVSWRLPAGLGDEVQRLMPDKKLGMWCLGLPEDERRAILTAFDAGDGSSNPKSLIAVIFQKDRQNLDVLQAIAVTLGYKTSIRSQGDQKWFLNIMQGRPTHLRHRLPGVSESKPIGREHYEGIVWCPTTGTGTFYARRDGFVFITGNSAYPEPRSPEDMSLPENAAFVYGRSADYMAGCYPVDAEGNDMRGYWRQAAGYGELIDVLEWYDEDQIAVGVLGSRRDRALPTSVSPVVSGGRLLMQVANRAGVCPVVCPMTVTLDRIAAAVSRIVPITDLLDKFMALESIAAEKNVFPDRYAVGTENHQPLLVTGPWKDGRTGEMNLLQDVSKVGELNSQPGEGAFRMLGLLERNARGSGGAPALFGGELTGSLRSGQTVNALGAFAVDPRVAESQEVMSAWLSTLNVAILESYKGWYGARQFSMWSGRPADPTKTDFVPRDDFDDTTNVVAYAFPGADVSSITVALGQAIGAKIMSLHSGRTKHPFVDQPEYEERQVQIEALDEALLTSMQTQAAQGQLPAIDLANIQELRSKGQTLAQSVIQAQKMAQERQAKAAPPPAPEAGMAASPETMPGMANPGAGAEAAPPAQEAIPAPEQAVQNIRALQLAYRSSPGQGVRGA